MCCYRYRHRHRRGLKPNYNSVYNQMRAYVNMLSSIWWSLSISDDETVRAMLDFFKIAPSQLQDNDRVAMAGRVVSAEGVTVGEAASTPDALLRWAVAHSVLAVNATKGLTVLLHFIQAKCLGVTERSGRTEQEGLRLARFIGLAER